MSDQKDPSPNVNFKDQMREAANAVVDSPPKSTDVRRLSKPAVDPPAQGRAGPTYKDQVFPHPRGVVVVVGPDGEKREVQGRPDSSLFVRQNHHQQQQQQQRQQPGAQRVGGVGTLAAVAPPSSLVAAELVDGDVERQRLEADLRPVIENEVLANLRANLPVAVVAEEDSRRPHNKKKAIVVTAVTVVLSIVLIVTAVVLGVVIPQSRRNDNKALSTPTLSTVPPTPAPTRTRFFLSQVGSDIADFPSSTSCLATSSDCTVIAGCTRTVALAPGNENGASSWHQLGAVWQDASFTMRVRSAALSGDGTLLALGRYDGVQVFRLDSSAAWINVTDVLINTIDDEDTDFGYAVAFSKDGSFLAVGEPGIDQIQQMGRVTVYENTDGVFARNGNVLRGLEELDHFGQNLAFSADGAVLAVAAPQDNSGQRDSVQHGYVRTFQYDNGRYIPLAQQLFGAIPSDTASSGFGAALALSSDGRILAAGGRGNNLNEDIYNAGHVRVFNFTSSNGWERLGQDLTGETVFAEFGTSVALSADGLLLAVGAPGGVNAAGNETGFVRLYRYDSESDQWLQSGSDIHGTLDQDKMRAAVALSDDGMTVVAAAERYVRVFAIAPL